MKPWERQYDSAPAPPVAPAAPKPWEMAYEAPPAPETSAVGDVATGIGQGLRDLGLGAKQRLDEGSAWLQNKVGETTIGKAINDLGATLGMPTTQQASDATNQQIAESRAADAELPSSGWRTTGKVVGSAAPAVAASFLPGGATPVGQTLIGALTGFFQPTLGDESVWKNTAAGGAGGVAGYGLGKGLGWLYDRAKNTGVVQQGANALRDKVAAEARAAGYTLPISQTNPNSLTGRLLEALSGKAQTGQHMAQRNQQVTQDLVAKNFGIPANDVTPMGIEGVRRAAGQAYDNVATAVPTVQKDVQFVGDALKLNPNAFGPARNPGFPGLANEGGEKVADMLLKGPGTVQAAETLEALKRLRDIARGVQRNPWPSTAEADLGRAAGQGAQAVEDLLERNAQRAGLPDLVQKMVDARRTIAQAHNVENAMHPGGGQVSAPKLAAQLAKANQSQSPGPLGVIARTADQFSDAMRDNTGKSVLPLSPLDYAAMAAGGYGASTDNPWLLALPFARMGARATVMSPFVQRTLGAPSYGPGWLTSLGNSAPVQRLLPTAGALAAPELGQ